MSTQISGYIKNLNSGKYYIPTIVSEIVSKIEMIKEIVYPAFVKNAILQEVYKQLLAENYEIHNGFITL